MNEKILGTRVQRRVGALAFVAAAALLTAACSSPSVGGGGSASTTESASYRANIAFSQCMRTHGMPDFPDPGPNTNFTLNGPLTGAAADTTSGKATIACEHLLPNGTASNGSSTSTQELTEGVAFAQCVRTHGVPSFPDPTVVNGGLNFNFTGTSSSQFKSAVTACRSVVPAGVKLP
jgi:hypothetical protein